jgi:HSP20 family molecular chaperone IbpA
MVLPSSPLSPFQYSYYAPIVQSHDVVDILSDPFFRSDSFSLVDNLQWKIDNELQMSNYLASLDTWGPDVDAIDHEDTIDFEVEVPGARIEELHIDLQGTTLTITGQHEEHNNVAGIDYALSEDKYKGFVHNITVPEGLRPDMVVATLNYGVLVVTIPKFPLMLAQAQEQALLKSEEHIESIQDERIATEERIEVNETISENLITKSEEIATSEEFAAEQESSQAAQAEEIIQKEESLAVAGEEIIHKEESKQTQETITVQETVSETVKETTRITETIHVKESAHLAERV